MEKGKIAIIEDDPFIGKYLQIILQKKGFLSFKPATTNSDAIELLNKEMPDLAIVDFNLAHGDSGKSIAKHIHLNYPYLPFIVYSSYDENYLANLFNGVFPDAILSKPSNIDQIEFSLIFCLYKRKLIAEVLYSKDDSETIQFEKDIVYILEQDETLIVKTKNAFEKSGKSLNQIEEEFTSPFFYRINPTTLVNILYIQTISPSSIFIKDQVFSFSPKFKTEFDLKIRKHSNS